MQDWVGRDIVDTEWIRWGAEGLGGMVWVGHHGNIMERKGGRNEGIGEEQNRTDRTEWEKKRSWDYREGGI